MPMRMFVTTLVTILALYPWQAHSQVPDFVWAVGPGGTGHDDSWSIAVDAGGNRYISGRTYSPAITFGSVTLTPGSNPCFIVKYDSAGTALWARSAPGNFPGCVAIGASGNPYALFFTDGACRVIKYTPAGDTLWSQPVTGMVGWDRIGSLAVDAVDHAYVVLDGPVWAFGAGGNSRGTFGPTEGSWGGGAVAVDSDGSVYFVGSFSSDTLRFGTIALPRSKPQDGFIAKFDSSGNALWASNQSGVPGNYVQPIAVGLDRWNDAIVLDRPLSNSETAVLKYDASGSYLWSRSFPWSSDSVCVAVADSGVVYLARQVPPLRVVALGPGGDSLWTRREEGLSSGVYGIAADSRGAVHLTGRTGGMTTLGSITLPAAPSVDLVIAKLAAFPPPPILLTPADYTTNVWGLPLLAWRGIPVSDGYWIQLSTDPAFPSPMIIDATVTDTIAESPRLDPATWYFWRVAVSVALERSPFSPTFAFRTAAAPPPVSLILPADSAVNQPRTESFRWGRPVGGPQPVDRFWFELATAAEPGSVIVRDTTLLDTVTTAGPLTHLGQYFWRVRAHAEIGWGTFSPWWRFTVIPDTTLSWGMNLVVSDACDSSITLRIGQAPYATDGTDPIYGEADIPPRPPTGYFDARFELPVTPSRASLYDIRSSEILDVTWTLRFQPSECGYPVTIRWDPGRLPNEDFTLVDEFGGVVVSVRMSDDSVLSVMNPSVTGLRIVYARRGAVDYRISQGWNMLSVPLVFDSSRVGNLFPTAVSPAYGFSTSGGYVASPTLVPGTGYWIKFAGEDSVHAEGLFSSNRTLTLTPGWNLIGAFESAADSAAIIADPSDLVETGYFSFQAGYHRTATLQPGLGYWVRARSAGSLQVPAPGARRLKAKN